MASSGADIHIYGTFQIRGGKHVVFDETTQRVYPLRQIQRTFLHGDRVLYTAVPGGTEKLELQHRQEQYAVGIIAQFRAGRSVLHFPHAPHFIAEICCILPVTLYDRIVVHLSETGAIQPIRVISSSACDDAAAILTAYTGAVCAPALPHPTYGASRYTRSDCVDLRHLFTFTVDPEDSLDLDDAISVDMETRHLYIHIVDIHAYLQSTDPAVEELALQRGQTLYLANEHTEHLLPVDAATRALSLVRGEERSVITVEIAFGEVGNEILAYGIYRSTIVVKERYTYQQVAHRLESQDQFRLLHLLAKVSGRTYFDLPSPRLVIGTNGVPTTCIVEHSADPAHALVANVMILANYVVSHHLHTYTEREGLYVPSRLHRAPSFSTAETTKVVCSNPIVNAFVTLKQWQRAEYSVDHTGHFGLELDTYVHFTSPMRRYADVLIHHLLAGATYDRDTLDSLTEYLSVRAAQVREFHSIYRTMKLWRYIHVAVHHPVAYATAVSAAGVAWYCPDYALNGFTHVSRLLPAGYWGMHAEKLVHLETGRAVSVGDAMEISSVACSPTTLQFSITLAISQITSRELHTIAEEG